MDLLKVDMVLVLVLVVDMPVVEQLLQSMVEILMPMAHIMVLVLVVDVLMEVECLTVVKSPMLFLMRFSVRHL